MPRVLIVTLIVQAGQSLPQNARAGSLADTCAANQHISVPDCHRFEQLDDFDLEGFNPDEILLVELLLDSLLQLLILEERHLHSGEQILNDTSEEGQILFEELGHVRITHSSNQKDVFWNCVILSSQFSGHNEDGFDSTHAEIVMILLGELLGRKRVKLHHLLRKRSSLGESFREEDNLSDKLIIRDHHRDGSEERFQVVGQFGTTRITGVHSNEHTEAEIQGNSLTLKIEFGQSSLDSRLNGQNLLGNNREHLNKDTIELVEATPGTTRSKTSEETGHHTCIKTV